MGVLGILLVQALTSAAIVRYFLTEARDGFHWWRTLVAPIIGGVAMIGACYLLIANRAALSGAGSAFFIQVIPWAVLRTFLIGVGVGLYYRTGRRRAPSSIGDSCSAGPEDTERDDGRWPARRPERPRSRPHYERDEQ